MALLLGIDVGTTHCKAAVFDEDGRTLKIGRAKTITHYDEHGLSWYEPQELWQVVISALREALDEDNAEDIVGVAVSSMGEAGIPIDKHGLPIYPIITWFDRRSIPQAQRIAELIHPDRVFRITGLDVNPIFSVPKLLWIRDDKPEVYARIAKWLCVADFINFKLTNEVATDYSIASRTMALDINTCTWSEEILNQTGLRESLFPQIVPSGTVIGKVSPEAARETGLRTGTSVVVGGHDHFCGSLASGVLLGKRILDSSGTSESISALVCEESQRSSTFAGFRIGRYLDPKYLYIVGGLVASGICVDWSIERYASLRDWKIAATAETQTLTYEQVMSEARQALPGANGLIFVSHLRGSGAPSWDPRSRGAFLGLTSAHKSPEIVRSVIEGLCFEVRIILECMAQYIRYPVELLTVIGGGGRNELWQQVKADITGIPVEVPDIEEATAKGTAILAGLGVGIYDDMKTACLQTYRRGKRYQPNIEVKETYDSLFQIYRQAYPAIREISQQLHGFSSSHATDDVAATNPGREDGNEK